MAEPTQRQWTVWIVSTAIGMTLAGIGSALGLVEFEPAWQAIVRFLSGMFS